MLADTDYFQSYFKLDLNGDTVFPRIVVATTILFLRVWCDNYSREETINFYLFCMAYIT